MWRLIWTMADAAGKRLQQQPQLELQQEQQMQRLLDELGASDDLVDSMLVVSVEREEERRRRVEARSKVAVPMLPKQLEDRRAGVRLVIDVVNQMNFHPKVWMDAVSVMDACNEEACPWGDRQAVPSLCLAAIRLCVKMEGHVKDLTAALRGLAVSLGVAAQLVTKARVDAAEHQILRKTAGRLAPAALLSWLHTLLIRVGTRLPSAFGDTLEWIRRRCIDSACSIMVWRPETQQPQFLSVGLLVLGFVAARILPLQALRGDLSEEEWARLYMQSFRTKVPECDTESSCEAILERVAMAARLPLSRVLGATRESLFTMLQVQLEGRRPVTAWWQQEKQNQEEEEADEESLG